jgi:hypothetical protein
MGRWSQLDVAAGGPQQKGNHRSLASANLVWGTGLLCSRLSNSKIDFLRDMARTEIGGLAVRCGALPRTMDRVHVKFGRYPDAAGCGVPDDGARR